MAGTACGVEQTKLPVYVSVETQPDGTAYVTVNSRKAIHLQKSNGSLKPVDRAKVIAERLSALLPKVTDPKTITSKVSGTEARLIVDGTLVAIATTSEAKARGTTTAKLAAMWAENLRKLLVAPPIVVEPASLLVPMGETRNLAVKTFVAGEIKADISDTSIISADAKAKAGSLVVAGLAVGDVVIKVSCGGREVSVPVKVRKYAAVVSGDAKATVTGFNPPSDLLARAALDAAKSAVTTEPGASVKSITLPKSVDTPAPGRSSTIPIMVEADGGDHIPAKLPAQVEIENRLLPKVESADIWFSNVPETVRKFQVLFTGRLAPAAESTRLLYHHYNDMSECMGFVIDVINPSAQPAELHIIEGVSDPMADVVIVGYVAGRDFMHRHEKNVGRILTLPPGTRRVIVSQAVHHPRTASGIMEFRQISGEQLIVRLIAKPERQRLADDPLGTDMPLAGFDASRLTFSDGVFPRPRKSMDFEYSVGKQWAFIRIGKNPIKHATLDKTLYGFGITYDANITMENPTDQVQTVEILFEATAGPAAGVFLLDGQYSEVKRLGPPEERLIGKYTLRPGQTRKATIRTIPLSGSAYPATIIVRAAK